ncbi:MAG: hypothetical protein H5T96_09660, partial [Tissierellales bacterium]|nr:hypothetical protein [Tissierellales bacterium]
FPKILGSTYKGEKATINAINRQTREIVEEGGKYVAKPLRIKNKTADFLLNRVGPYLFAPSEAFEEGSQYAITKGTQDYYDKAYKGKDVDFFESLAEGVKQTLTTDEGMENILIGGFSGGLMLGRGANRELTEKRNNTKEAVAALNKKKLSDFTKETINSVARGTQLQEERESLLKNGDVRESKDLETDYIINYLAPRIKYGRFNLVKADIDEYRQLASTDEGFAQLQSEGKALESDTREAYLQRLDGLESTATNMQSLYQSLNLRYGGMVDKDKKPIYSSAVMDKMVYAAMKVADYDIRIPQLISQLSSLGVDINTILKDVVNGNTDSYNQAIAKIDGDTTLNDDQKIDLNTALEDAAHLSVYRDFYLKEYNDIQSKPKQYQEVEAQPTKTKPGEPIPTVTIKTKKGEKDVEIGTEYFLGRVVKYDKDGNEVYRSPKITILGENEDGTIRIKDSTGKVKDVDPKELEDYNLAKVSDTLKNKKAKFFMENWNNVYEFNFGKGKKQKGRLEYSPKEGILLFTYKDKKGRIRSIEVTGDQFVPKKGYTNPMIKAVRELTPAQKQAQDEFTAENDERIAAKREARLGILNDLFEELSGKQKNIEKLISQKKGEIANIQKDIASLKNQLEKSGEDIDKRVKGE